MGKKAKAKRKPKGRSQQSKSATVRRGESPLVVFVSSAIAGMEEDRESVRRAVESFLLTRAWLFEYTPASSEQLEESYLSKVRSCDLFVLLVGDADREAVRREYAAALDAGLPVADRKIAQNIRLTE